MMSKEKSTPPIEDSIEDKLDSALDLYFSQRYHTVLEPDNDGRAELLALIESEKAKHAAYVIGDGEEMYFSDEVPVYKDLRQYMDHVATIREVQRDVQRKRAGL